jgi:hypothetical protein
LVDTHDFRASDFNRTFSQAILVGNVIDVASTGMPPAVDAERMNVTVVSARGRPARLMQVTQGMPPGTRIRRQIGRSSPHSVAFRLITLTASDPCDDEQVVGGVKIDTGVDACQE